MSAPADVPAAVAALAGDRAVRPVWRNELGGLTFEVGSGARREFVKWTPPGAAHPDPAAEARRLRWAGGFVPVPRVLGTGRDDDGAWLHTVGLDGENAVSDRWRSDPMRAARAIGRGLRSLHDALPVQRCPFDWGVERRIRVLAGETGRAPDDVRRAVGEPPAADRLVVCHGDACAPNTLLADDGSVTGHVDLGSLGVADRWADLAIASWSTVWNYGPGYEVPLLAAYGVEPDHARIGFYRALWGNGPWVATG